MPYLLAQMAAQATTPGWMVLGVVPLALGFGVIALLPMLLIWRNGRMAHEERLRAMDLGFAPTTRVSRWPQAFFCAAIGAGVPIGTFLITWLATQSMVHVSTSTEIWIAPCVVSVPAIIGATIVAAVSFSRGEGSSVAEKIGTHTKPVANPEAFDFAGRGGHG